jgi:hypothetical protein
MSELPFITELLLRVNLWLSSVVLIVAFSLLAYIAFHNTRSDIARAFCIMLAGVVVVYAGDVLIGQASKMETKLFLLRAQWLGIAFVPAAYLHFSDALLSFSGQPSLWRRLAVMAGYGASALFFGLALGTDLVVRDGVAFGPVAQFDAGPLFWLYLLYFVLTCVGGLVNIQRARQSALVPAMRRRLTYLGLTFLAPGLGVFPYLVAAGAHEHLSANWLLALATIGSLGVALMLVVMAYSVAFQGVLIPERLVKYDFVRWLLYGPFVGVTVILCLQLVPPTQRATGLPADTIITFGVLMMTVLMPIFVSAVKPYVDTLVFMQDRAEIDWLRALPRKTFTRSDLRQLLENTLIAICGALRVPTGFVVGPAEEGYQVKALVGSRRDVRRFVTDHPLAELMGQLAQAPRADNDQMPDPDSFVQSNGFYLMPLRGRDGAFLGALGVAYSRQDLPAETRRMIGALTHQMELALQNVHIQQQIFGTLRSMGPEMASLQEFSTRLDQATPATLDTLDSEVSLHPEFSQLVKDALSHYWGGPKLSDSPLLGLRTVRRSLEAHGGSPTRALQGVLRQAIENLRPDHQLDPSAQEWMLYNILELRFLQGKRVRDIAEKLAISESDLYRKQRVAVEEVARQLALMEEGEKAPK